jgi:archaellum component FlaC
MGKNARPAYHKTMTTSAFATKQDVEEIVGRVVGEIVSDALHLISERFDRVDERFEQIDRRFEEVDRRFEQIDQRFDRMDRRFDRLGDKMETTVAVVDHHTIDIRELQRKTA